MKQRGFSPETNKGKAIKQLQDMMNVAGNEDFIVAQQSLYYFGDASVTPLLQNVDYLWSSTPFGVDKDGNPYSGMAFNPTTGFLLGFQICGNDTDGNLNVIDTTLQPFGMQGILNMYALGSLRNKIASIVEDDAGTAITFKEDHGIPLTAVGYVDITVPNYYGTNGGLREAFAVTDARTITSALRVDFGEGGPTLIDVFNEGKELIGLTLCQLSGNYPGQILVASVAMDPNPMTTGYYD